jgi:hypothetical protein
MGTSGFGRLGHTTKRVFTKTNAIPPQPSKSNQNGLASFLRRFKRGVAVLVISLIVIVILALAFVIPPGAATIPLNVSYTVGETLIYNTTETGFLGGFNYQTGQMQVNQSFPSTSSVDTQVVQSFDGQTYNISHSEALSLGTGRTTPISYHELVNKTGFSEIIAPNLAPNEPSVNQTVINPVLAFLASPVVKVGDTAVIPITTSSAGVNTTGSVTVTFVDIQNITVPAGTFNVFRVDSSSNNDAETFQHGLFGNGTMTMTQNFTQQSYIEYDTGKLIQSTENSYTVISFGSSTNQPNSLLPILADNTTFTTQLTADIMPGQPLPSPTPTATSPQQQESMAFLHSVSGLDMQHYTVQSQEALAAGFYKFTLTSSDSSVDLLFNFNNSHVTWCQLYPLQGTPDFATPSTNMLAATTFLINYYSYSQAPYIPTLQSMLDNVTGNASTTVTQGTISLNVSVSEDTTSLVWTNAQTPSQTLILDMQNGGFSFFNDAWT